MLILSFKGNINKKFPRLTFISTKDEFSEILFDKLHCFFQFTLSKFHFKPELKIFGLKKLFSKSEKTESCEENSSFIRDSNDPFTGCFKHEHS